MLMVRLIMLSRRLLRKLSRVVVLCRMIYVRLSIRVAFSNRYCQGRNLLSDGVYRRNDVFTISSLEYVCSPCSVICVLAVAVSTSTAVKVTVRRPSGLASTSVGPMDLVSDGAILSSNSPVAYHVSCLVDDDYCHGYGKVELSVGTV